MPRYSRFRRGRGRSRRSFRRFGFRRGFRRSYSRFRTRFRTIFRTRYRTRYRNARRRRSSGRSRGGMNNMLPMLKKLCIGALIIFGGIYVWNNFLKAWLTKQGILKI